MSDLKKKLLGLVFEMSDDDKKPENTNQNHSAANQGSFAGAQNVNQNFNSGNNNFSQPVFVAPTVTDTSKFKNHFLDLMKKANLPGNDYYEFNMTLDALEGKISDERTKFIAAFTPLSLNDLTLKKINDTANSYVSALDNDFHNFNSAIEENKKNSLGAQKNKIEENSRKIQEIQSQIQRLNEENITLSNQIAEEERVINESKQGYEIEYRNMRNKILSDLQKANEYLK